MESKKHILWVLFLALIPTIQAGEMKSEGLEVGDMAPAFKAMDQDGNPWELAANLDKEYLVVYFYPAAMTGGCTKQACSYRDHQAAEGAADFNVVGVSGDAVENLKYFQIAENLNFTLLSDPDGSIAKAFGVPVREGEKSIQRTVDGEDVTLTRTATTSRWTFVIDADCKVVYKAPQVSPTEDLANVLAFIQGNGRVPPYGIHDRS